MVVLAAAIGIFMVPRVHHYYQVADPRPDYSIHPAYSDDTVRILFMGDSWAAYHQAYDTLLARLVSDHSRKPCKVSSAGYVGAKSKAIYEYLFDDTKPFVVQHPDYCVISAGINDAAAKMGADFYITHYSHIVWFLLGKGIVPVVLDMPDVDYKAVYQREGLIANLRHRISSFLTGTDLYSFSSYRAALRKTITQSGWQDSVVYVRADEWLPNIKAIHDECFRADGIHLNEKGYRLLDSCLSLRIAEREQLTTP